MIDGRSKIDIANCLDQIPEDKNLGKPKIEKYAIYTYKALERSFWTRALITFAVFIPISYLLLPKYEVFVFAIFSALAGVVLIRLLKP